MLDCGVILVHVSRISVGGLQESVVAPVRVLLNLGVSCLMTSVVVSRSLAGKRKFLSIFIQILRLKIFKRWILRSLGAIEAATSESISV